MRRVGGQRYEVRCHQQHRSRRHGATNANVLALDMRVTPLLFCALGRPRVNDRKRLRTTMGGVSVGGSTCGIETLDREGITCFF
jgi:hypothetical protein